MKIFCSTQPSIPIGAMLTLIYYFRALLDGHRAFLFCAVAGVSRHNQLYQNMAQRQYD
ncbi:hypothetical protein RYA05_04085 [Pseudomonas syringae pv. actinidiae]|nr:hypothetical protein [Pseudomonas syringae pv. actinidiae]